MIEFDLEITRVTIYRLHPGSECLLVIGENERASSGAATYLAHWTGSEWQGSDHPNPAPLVFPFEKDAAEHRFEHHKELLEMLQESHRGS
jgi:hypothetical protein